MTCEQQTLYAIRRRAVLVWSSTVKPSTSLYHLSTKSGRNIRTKAKAGKGKKLKQLLFHELNITGAKAPGIKYFNRLLVLRRTRKPGTSSISNR